MARYVHLNECPWDQSNNGRIMNAVSNINHVVLADDDADHGIIFEKILKQIDPSKKLTIVQDGSVLIKLLADKIPDLIFLDLNMPCKNGLECLAEIREVLKLEELPIVVYSSSTQMTDIQKSFIRKADLYMVKPFNSFHLKNALETLFSVGYLQQYMKRNFYFMNNRFVPFTA
jgi:CheY-like chemotaxis protein